MSHEACEAYLSKGSLIDGLTDTYDEQLRAVKRESGLSKEREVGDSLEVDSSLMFNASKGSEETSQRQDLDQDQDGFDGPEVEEEGKRQLSVEEPGHDLTDPARIPRFFSDELEFYEGGKEEEEEDEACIAAALADLGVDLFQRVWGRGGDSIDRGEDESQQEVAAVGTLKDDAAEDLLEEKTLMPVDEIPQLEWIKASPVVPEYTESSYGFQSGAAVNKLGVDDGQEVMGVGDLSDEELDASVTATSGGHETLEPGSVHGIVVPLPALDSTPAKRNAVSQSKKHD